MVLLERLNISTTHGNNELIVIVIKFWRRYFGMNNLEDILKLLNKLADLPFESMEVSTSEVTVKVSRGSTATPVAVPVPVYTVQSASAVPEDEPRPQGKKPVAIVSPIIGVFYSSPSPDDGPFVKVGEHVRAGQTLCIVEAMKLMNEIPSPVSGTLVEMMAADGSEVEVGQTLFLVELAEG
jgi:acetyl-CoA carboxylase biotin carboxyl carrier protein